MNIKYTHNNHHKTTTRLVQSCDKQERERGITMRERKMEVEVFGLKKNCL